MRNHKPASAAQELVEATPAGQLVLYPQVFLASLALLDLPWVHVHVVVLQLFSKVRPLRICAVCSA